MSMFRKVDGVLIDGIVPKNQKDWSFKDWRPGKVNQTAEAQMELNQSTSKAAGTTKLKDIL